MKKFCSSLVRYARRETTGVAVGGVCIGGSDPVRLQSMTNTDTNDTEASVAQIERIADAGGEIVRLTAQGRREAANLANIEARLRADGYATPLVADIHFLPAAALIAAENVEKVRINPGNFNSGRDKNNSDNGDNSEGDFLKLLDICKRRGTALRIGVNHGSLAPAVVEKYGDTPRGMVESAMEFLRICRDNDFSQVVVSMKSSNVRVMVHAYRMLVAAMNGEEMKYPLHLGVTEAGNGRDGRVKSAAGIGALLSDGIGDTIRVSLTEAPEHEIPVARKLVDYFEGREGHAPIPLVDESLYSPYSYKRRAAAELYGVGGGKAPVIWSEVTDEAKRNIVTADIGSVEKIPAGKIVLLTTANINGIAEQRAFFLKMEELGKDNPVIIKRTYSENSLEDLQIKAAADTGMLFMDGYGDGLFITNSEINENSSQAETYMAHGNAVPEISGGNISQDDIDSLSLAILQAARVRISGAEYIACPSCGRTLFDIEETLCRIQERTSHLKGIKIGVMGCIVNGPGEMADADYGYVGAGAGRITLYKGQEVVRRNIPAPEAVDALIELIKQNGDWTEP